MTLCKKAFTLIEMLVVIAIIAILAAALFPAIQGAIDQARATGMKQKGRGIWVAIVSANSEREPLGVGSLWPTNVPCTKAQNYFNFLMSKGDSNFVAAAQNRICGDLSPSTLAGAGVTAATGVDGHSVASKNMAWHVVVVNDSTASESAFLITKNMKLSGSALDNTAVPAGNVNLDKNMAPFNDSHGVWVSRGGGTFDARPKYLTIDRVNGPETNSVWQCDDAADGS